MRTVEPGPDAFEGFGQQVPEGQPIVLVNLLRFQPQVCAQGEELTGRQLYGQYAKALEPLLMAVGGRPVWRGQGRFVLIGPGGEHWDEVILVAYPSRGAFEQLRNSPEYRACAGLRTAALEDSRLIVATAPQHISWVAWSLHKLVTRSRRRRTVGMAWLRRVARAGGGGPWVGGPAATARAVFTGDIQLAGRPPRRSSVTAVRADGRRWGAGWRR
jgi:uncharacterized protein (DUF1330 family)